ncbi:hypothetical protein P9112_007431 [Eukaryota sp. TZLM1-RC]
MQQFKVKQTLSQHFYRLTFDIINKAIDAERTSTKQSLSLVTFHSTTSTSSALTVEAFPDITSSSTSLIVASEEPIVERNGELREHTLSCLPNGPLEQVLCLLQLFANVSHVAEAVVASKALLYAPSMSSRAPLLTIAMVLNTYSKSLSTFIEIPNCQPESLFRKLITTTVEAFLSPLDLDIDFIQQLSSSSKFLLEVYPELGEKTQPLLLLNASLREGLVETFERYTMDVLEDQTEHDLQESKWHLLLKLTPHIVPFEVRSSALSRALLRLSSPQSRTTNRIDIQRDSILASSMVQLLPQWSRSPFSALNPPFVVFYDQFERREAGVDQSGLYQDLCSALLECLFEGAHQNRTPPLFVTNEDGTFLPNASQYAELAASVPAAYTLEDIYSFAGFFAASLIVRGQSLGRAPSKVIIHRLLDRPFSASDISYIDPKLYHGLLNLRSLGQDELAFLDLTFSVTDPLSGRDVDLVTNGSEIVVTSSNLDWFINANIHYIYCQYSTAIDFFCSAFTSILHTNLLSLFGDLEIQSLFRGTINFDIDEFLRHLQGPKETDAFQMFAQAVRDLTQRDLRLFLRFCTGSSFVPLLGFGQISPPITISFTPEHDGLLRASTCTNAVHCPSFHNKDVAISRITTSIHEGLSFEEA